MTNATPSTPALSPPPKRGELFVLLTQEGDWSIPIRFLRFLDGTGTVGIFADPAGKFLRCKLADVARPMVHHGDHGEHGESNSSARPSSVSSVPSVVSRLSAGQMALIHCLRHDAGLDVDDVRALTPRGSISDLSRNEAAKLVDRLRGGNRASLRQRRYAADLAARAGMTDAQLSEMLRRHYSLDSIEDPRLSVRDASRIILTLKDLAAGPAPAPCLNTGGVFVCPETAP